MGSGVICEIRHLLSNSPKPIDHHPKPNPGPRFLRVRFTPQITTPIFQLQRNPFNATKPLIFHYRFHRFCPNSSLNDGGFAVADAADEEEEEDLSFYQLLGISESVSSSEIKQAYKQLARKYHPDVSPPDRTEEYTRRFILVQEAYETLSDPMRRALYDRDLSKELHLAFSARKRYSHRSATRHEFDQGFAEKNEWRSQWQDQLAGLKKKSMNNDSRENMSWAARMRMQREESFGKH
ncbi:hypothetical protein Scep_010650 [Stephania cephalantha]|uniref:J domain-containing protein n=1 Tax=Stephania cephalantha TaxID=152367 RepID=A0AAP0JW73_9MAGN